MNKLKESILIDVKKGSGDTTNESNETTSGTNTVTTTTTSTTNTTTTRSNDTYFCDVGILVALIIGICVFFVFNTS